MRRLFLVDGAFGTGKKQLVEYIRSQSSRTRATVLGKYSVANHKHVVSPQISVDLTMVDGKKFDDYVAQRATNTFYHYKLTEQRYGFFKADLDKALNDYSDVFVVVRDKATILQIQREYHREHVIPVYIYTDEDQLKQGLRDNGIPERDISFHVEDRQQRAWQDYLEEPEFYRLVRHSPDERQFNRTIDHLIETCSYVPGDELWISHLERFPLIEPLIGHKSELLRRLDLYPYERNVFLMMKFRDSNKDVAEFIKETIEARSLKCVRADDPEWRITDDIYNPIAVHYCCKFGIALFDECFPSDKEANEYSPNVAYELGMMHLERKQVLILRHSSLSEVPFNLVVRLRENYTQPLELQKHVRKWVSNLSV